MMFSRLSLNRAETKHLTLWFDPSFCDALHQGRLLDQLPVSSDVKESRVGGVHRQKPAALLAVCVLTGSMGADLTAGR